MERSEQEWAEDRIAMVRLLAGSYGIASQRVLQAMRTVPRHRFIPELYLPFADPYGDHPCPIGHEQTVSQPFIVAYMTQALDPQPGERVLEVGSGSGYQAAVLAAMGAEVYSLEVVPELARHAQRVLEELGVPAHIRCGDGSAGWPAAAPFDVIIGTCAPALVPVSLSAQLSEGGRMMFPVGTDHQRLVLLRRKDGHLTMEEDLAVRFVPLVHAPV